MVSKLGENRGCLVGATVVNDDDLVGAGQGQEPLDDRPDRVLLVEGRNEDGDIRGRGVWHGAASAEYRLPLPVPSIIKEMGEQFDLVLKGGTVALGDRIAEADIAIREGRIAEIGSLTSASAAETVDVSGLHVLPGMIDTQVHFREPGLEHKEDLESGTRAAAAGGVTTVFEMPNTVPNTITAEALADKIERAKGRTWVNTACFVGASPENIDQLAELEQLPGTPGVKIFMGSSTGSLLVEKDEDLRRVLEAGFRPCPIHAEDEPRLRARKAEIPAGADASYHPIWRDAEAAKIATERIIRLSEETGRPVHVLHVSTADELPILAEAKARGLRVTCEVTPQHLTFSADDYARLGTHLQMNPPIRSREHREGIRQALADGLFDVFGSDHAPHTYEEKQRPYPESPSGMPGVQTMTIALLELVREGLIDLASFVRMSASRPAQLYGVREKGQIALGFEADLAIYDMNGKTEITKNWLQSKCGWSPFEGRTYHSRLVHTVVHGRFAVRDGQLAEPALGRIPRFTWKDQTSSR